MSALTEQHCWDGRSHNDDGTIAYDEDLSADTQHSRCRHCHQPLTRFWIDEEPGERNGGWSRWRSKLYVIEELVL